MSLFSFFRKNKQESASDGHAFYSRAEEDPSATRGRGKRRQGKQGAEADAPVDPVLPEKKRARRRLIGAVALVLAAVVGLPMILDSEPKPLADDIAIQIPSKDKLLPPPATPRSANPPSVSKIAASASLDPKEEMVAPPISSETQAASKTISKTPDSVAAAVPDAPLRSKGKREEPARHDAEAAKAASGSKANQVAHAAAKTDDKPIARDDDAARARALLEGKADPGAADKKPAKFVIQVAALATKEKVNELQARLKSAGIKSYTQKIATVSGDRTRIRVGPFNSKEEAEKVRSRIVKLGLNGTLVPA